MKGVAIVVAISTLLLATACAESLEKPPAPILTGAEAGHTSTVVPVPGQNGWTPLHWAVITGDVPLATALLDEGARLDPRDGTGATPLIVAARRGEHAFVKFLLDRGADIEAADGDNGVLAGGDRALHWAVHRQCADVVTLLLDRKANVNAADKDGWTPLQFAARLHDAKAVKRLLDRKADPKGTDAYGRTPLHAALLRSTPRHPGPVVELLLAAKADPKAADENGWTPLHAAAAVDYANVVARLIEAGADPTAQTEEKKTAWDLAVRFRSRHAMAQLHAHAPSAPKTEERLIRAIQAGRWKTVLSFVRANPALAYTEARLSRRAPRRAQEPWEPLAVERVSAGKAPLLHLAAAAGQLELIDAILAAGVEVTLKSEHSSSALAAAARAGQVAAVQRLIDRGAHPDGPDRKGSPLREATAAGQRETAQALIDSGAALDRVDSNKQTVLHQAAEGGSVALIELLLKGGAAINAQDSHQMTPLHLAVRAHQDGSVATLLVHGATVDPRSDSGQTPLLLSYKNSGDRWMEWGPWQAKLEQASRIHRILVRHGADQTVKNHKGQTLLHLAVLARDRKTVRALLKQKADPNAVDRAGQAPLEASYDRADILFYEEESKARLRRLEADIRDQLIRHGTDLKHKTPLGQTPLHLAATHGDPRTIDQLIALKAPIDPVDSRGQTPLLATFDRLLLSYETRSRSDDGLSRARLRLVHHGADLARRNKKGQTILHMAAAAGDQKLVEKLIAKGAKVNAIDKQGLTILHATFDIETPEELQSFGWRNGGVNTFVTRRRAIRLILIKRRVPLTNSDESGRTALHLAAADHDLATVRALLSKKKVKVNAEDDAGVTPLLATYGRSRDESRSWWEREEIEQEKKELNSLRKLLIDRGANLAHEDKKGRTLLHRAASAGDLAMIEQLVDQKAVDVNATDALGRTPLHRTYLTDEDEEDKEEERRSYRSREQKSVRRKRMTKARWLLIRKGANPAIKDKAGKTVLQLASVNNDSEMVRLLAVKQGKINDVLTNGQTLLQEAVARDQADQVGWLLKQGAKTNPKSGAANSPLHIALLARTTMVAELLLDAGADLHALNRRGQTPLHIAAQQGDPKRVVLLLKKGAKVDAEDHRGWTPLHAAVFNSRVDAAKMLLIDKANVDHVAKEDQRTPLHRAVEWESEPMILLLLSHHAKVNTKDIDGDSPLQTARQLHLKKIAALLIKHGAKAERGSE